MRDGISWLDYHCLDVQVISAARHMVAQDIDVDLMQSSVEHTYLLAGKSGGISM